MDVSVVVPCYNHERYVDRCLGSIDAQDVPLEVIVLDDGSTDRTWARIEAFKWSPRHTVKIVRTANRGAFNALNHGFQMSSGRWLSICNSDDFFEAGRISVLRDALVSSGRRFAFSGVRYVDDAETDITRSAPYAVDLATKQAAISTFASVGFSMLPNNPTISTGNFFFERSLVGEVGYMRPYRLCHDWDYALRCLLVTEPLYVPAPLYAYRLHHTNSFPDLLAQVAARECPELMRRFMRAVITRVPQNPFAPSPHNWPGFFEAFIDEYRYQPYLVGWEGIDDAPFFPPDPTVLS